MLVDHFPLAALRLRTPRLELRLPTPEELGELADLAADGVHDPAVMPFTVPWTDQDPAARARSVVHHHWQRLGDWTPRNWALNLTVFRDGVVVGQQTIGGKDVAITGEVHTGSWLGLRYHRQGIGTEMRAAVLELAFAGLGVAEAASGAATDNVASLGVSRRLGYEPDGVERHALRGELAIVRRLRLTRGAWERHRTVPTTIDGLTPCLGALGLAAV